MSLQIVHVNIFYLYSNIITVIIVMALLLITLISNNKCYPSTTTLYCFFRLEWERLNSIKLSSEYSLDSIFFIIDIPLLRSSKPKLNSVASWTKSKNFNSPCCKSGCLSEKMHTFRLFVLPLRNIYGIGYIHGFH